MSTGKIVFIAGLLFCVNVVFAQQPTLYIKARVNSSWQAFDKGIPKDATISGVAEVGATMFVTTDFHGVFKLSAGQSTWLQVGLGLPKDIDINAIEAVENRLIIGTYKNGIWHSSDFGKSWYPSAKQPTGLAIRALINKGEYVLAGTDKGVYKSQDKGVSWEHFVGDKQVLGFAQNMQTTYVALQDGAASLGTQGSWKYIYQGDALHDIAFLNGAVYAFTLGKGLWRSNKLSMNWDKVQAGMGTDNLYTFEMASFGNLTYAAQWKGVFISTNRGNSWFQDIGLPNTIAFGLLKNTSWGLIAAAAMR